MKVELKKRSYREAAELLRNRMDMADLPDDLSEKEESEMREFIRNKICDDLRKKGLS